MGWRETRAAARDKVHETFLVPALYYAPGSADPIEVNVRHHTRDVLAGDLEREGYGERIVDVNRIVLDTSEVTPARGGKVVMPDEETHYLETFERQDGDRYAVWNVVRSRL